MYTSRILLRNSLLHGSLGKLFHHLSFKMSGRGKQKVDWQPTPTKLSVSTSSTSTSTNSTTTTTTSGVVTMKIGHKDLSWFSPIEPKKKD